MSVARIILRSSRAASRACERRFSSAPYKQVDINKRGNDTADEYRKIMKEKPLNPHMTNTTSTIANELPSIGKDNAPPELISSVDGDFVPKDARPENTEKMTGGTQSGEPSSGVNADLAVGEIEGGTFRVEPLRRTGEDDNTMRARLLYQSRKRGTLESDLLFSTFADENLGKMNTRQLREYDAFLDENDWDLYYWATQQAPQTSMAYAEGAGPGMATKDVQGKDLAPDGGPVSQTDAWRNGEARSGEWANTVGKFRPSYRPVPLRWKSSEILSLVRKHVIDRSAGSVHIVGEQVDESTPRKGGGLGFMPELKNFDR